MAFVADCRGSLEWTGETSPPPVGWSPVTSEPCSQWEYRPGPPSTVPAVVPEDEIAGKVRDPFEDHYAVIIMDSDFTTFAEVEGACVALFGYTSDEAAALAMEVHTTGEALAAVMGEVEARRAVSGLRGRNVRSRMERI